MSKDMLDVSVHDARGVVADLLEKLGGPNGQEWLSAVKRFLRKEEPVWDKESIVATYFLTINYGQSVEEALKAGGYDWTNKNLTSRNFPPTRRGTETVRLHLVHFSKAMEDDEVTNELERQGLRDSTIDELLAFGINSETRYLQLQFPIAARGSVWQNLLGNCHVPVLWGDDRARSVCLPWRYSRWDSHYRFLAACK